MIKTIADDLVKAVKKGKKTVRMVRFISLKAEKVNSQWELDEILSSVVTRESKKYWQLAEKLGIAKDFFGYENVAIGSIAREKYSLEGTTATGLGKTIA